VDVAVLYAGYVQGVVDVGDVVDGFGHGGADGGHDDRRSAAVPRGLAGQIGVVDLPGGCRGDLDGG
jgi:hypothetical protein